MKTTGDLVYVKDGDGETLPMRIHPVAYLIDTTGWNKCYDIFCSDGSVYKDADTDHDIPESLSLRYSYPTFESYRLPDDHPTLMRHPPVARQKGNVEMSIAFSPECIDWEETRKVNPAFPVGTNYSILYLAGGYCIRIKVPYERICQELGRDQSESGTRCFSIGSELFPEDSLNAVYMNRVYGEYLMMIELDKDKAMPKWMMRPASRTSHYNSIDDYVPTLIWMKKQKPERIMERFPWLEWKRDGENYTGRRR